MVETVSALERVEASQRVPQARYEASEAKAYAAGVQAVLAIAKDIAARIRAQPWKPTREGAADALEALAEAGEDLTRNG